jgi:hypothetical protein
VAADCRAQAVVACVAVDWVSDQVVSGLLASSTARTVNGTSAGRAFPTSGTVTRYMQATLTYTGQAPTTSTRREVITYDGTNVDKVVINKDGVTQNCTLPLPRGRLTCS